ncbi:hypothetical protein [Streptomyces sp. 3214.6]|uniref:hypothetical protein n=1 Tax=Streptomyces sp. 3214.6 TaxID=1882757 RepID=UPI0015D55230|nr:hypothetical protein [Streptomyces sp. 3214.6]
MKLSDLSPLMARREDGGLSAGMPVQGRRSIDLLEVKWQLEAISAADFIGMPTAASDAGCIEIYAENPVHWVAVRRPERGRDREEHGTWLRPPTLIVRRLLDPSDSGLQVVEGSTPWCPARVRCERLTVFRGRAADD